jgi:hypothetical protein
MFLRISQMASVGFKTKEDAERQADEDRRVLRRLQRHSCELYVVALFPEPEPSASELQRLYNERMRAMLPRNSGINWVSVCEMWRNIRTERRGDPPLPYPLMPYLAGKPLKKSFVNAARRAVGLETLDKIKRVQKKQEASWWH